MNQRFGFSDESTRFASEITIHSAIGSFLPQLTNRVVTSAVVTLFGLSQAEAFTVRPWCSCVLMGYPCAPVLMGFMRPPPAARDRSAQFASSFID